MSSKPIDYIIQNVTENPSPTLFDKDPKKSEAICNCSTFILNIHSNRLLIKIQLTF